MPEVTYPDIGTVTCFDRRYKYLMLQRIREDMLDTHIKLSSTDTFKRFTDRERPIMTEHFEYLSRLKNTIENIPEC